MGQRDVHRLNLTVGKQRPITAVAARRSEFFSKLIGGNLFATANRNEFTSPGSRNPLGKCCGDITRSENAPAKDFVHFDSLFVTSALPAFTPGFKREN